MPSNITITVTAQTAQAAAALQQFAAQSAGALNVVASGSRQIADEADKAATHIRGMAYTFRSGIDAIRFGLAGGGDRALFYAADEGLRALLANGMKLGQLVPILGAVGAAAGAGYLVWDIYAQKQRAVTEAAIAMQKALLQLPDTLKNVQDAANTGVIGQGAADTLAQMLTGKKSYTVSMPASQALTEGRISQDQFDAARAAASRPSGKTNAVFQQPGYWKSKNTRQQTSRDRYTGRNVSQEIAGLEARLHEIGFGAGYCAAIRSKVTHGRDDARALHLYQAALSRTLRSKLKTFQPRKYEY